MRAAIAGGGAVLAGVLSGLGSSMIGGRKLLRLGQGSLGLTAIWPSGPPVLLDAGPRPERWVKPRSRPPRPRWGWF